MLRSELCFILPSFYWTFGQLNKRWVLYYCICEGFACSVLNWNPSHSWMDESWNAKTFKNANSYSNKTQIKHHFNFPFSSSSSLFFWLVWCWHIFCSSPKFSDPFSSQPLEHGEIGARRPISSQGFNKLNIGILLCSCTFFSLTARLLKRELLVVYYSRLILNYIMRTCITIA